MAKRPAPLGMQEYSFDEGDGIRSWYFFDDIRSWYFFDDIWEIEISTRAHGA